MTPYFESIIGFDPDGIRRIYAQLGLRRGKRRETTSEAALIWRH
jgi:hypothetical protein